MGSNVSAEVRAPISSSCIANPFNQDGMACQGGAIGTPFFLFSDGDAAHAKLFANAYATDAPVTGGSSGVTGSGATVSGTENPQGGPVTARSSSAPAPPTVSRPPRRSSARRLGSAVSARS